MSDQGNRKSDPEALKATTAEKPGAAGQRPPRAPMAPRRKAADLQTGPGREGGNIPDQLTRSQEAMEIQNQASDFKAKVRQTSAERKAAASKKTGPAAALTGASSLLKLATVSWTCSLVCLCAALVVFFWPLFVGVVKGLPAPETKSKPGGKLVVYTPGDTTMAQGQEPGGKWSKGEGKGGGESGAGAGGGPSQRKGLGSMIPKLPIAGPLGPDRELAFMIFSKPDKAEVILDGQPRGKTPVGANLTCRENEQVQLEMRKNGYKLWEKVFRCKEGRIKVEGTLKRE